MQPPAQEACPGMLFNVLCPTHLYLYVHCNSSIRAALACADEIKKQTNECLVKKNLCTRGSWLWNFVSYEEALNKQNKGSVIDLLGLWGEEWSLFA